MDRRHFMKTAGFAAGAAMAAPIAKQAKADEQGKFKLKYAPSFGMFRELGGKDLIDQIKFIDEMGFRAIFDNSLPKKPAALQEKIANELARRNMDLGPFVLYADFKVKSFVLSDPKVADMLVKKMKEGVEVAKRTGAKWALVVPGRFADNMEWAYQTANVIDNLRRCCDVVEPHGLTLVLEPLNAWINHPGLFLTKIPQAYEICRAVNRPSCKIVDDLYHQQITEGNLIPNIDMAWSEIASFHLGDTPGRKEPGTGEINYKNIFRHIYHQGLRRRVVYGAWQIKEGQRGRAGGH